MAGNRSRATKSGEDLFDGHALMIAVLTFFG